MTSAAIGPAAIVAAALAVPLCYLPGFESPFADPKLALTTVVQVAYGTDLARLLPLLSDAVHAVPRVLNDPPSAVQLSNFAADGLELTIVFWIADVENGQGNVRSDVNMAVLRCLTEHGVDIPFPQRVVRQA